MAAAAAAIHESITTFRYNTCDEQYRKLSERFAPNKITTWEPLPASKWAQGVAESQQVMPLQRRRSRLAATHATKDRRGQHRQKELVDHVDQTTEAKG